MEEYADRLSTWYVKKPVENVEKSISPDLFTGFRFPERFILT